MDVTWRKSSFSDPVPTCVELAWRSTDDAGPQLVRDSKSPEGGVLRGGAALVAFARRQ